MTIFLLYRLRRDSDRWQMHKIYKEIFHFILSFHYLNSFTFLLNPFQTSNMILFVFSIWFWRKLNIKRNKVENFFAFYKPCSNLFPFHRACSKLEVTCFCFVYSRLMRAINKTGWVRPTGMMQPTFCILACENYSSSSNKKNNWKKKCKI